MLKDLSRLSGRQYGTDASSVVYLTNYSPFEAAKAQPFLFNVSVVPLFIFLFIDQKSHVTFLTIINDALMRCANAKKIEAKIQHWFCILQKKKKSGSS